MERLTRPCKNTEDGKFIRYVIGNYTGIYSNNELGDVMEKLAAYEDAEEQGLLLRLPCPIGTTVWCIMTGMTGKHPILFAQEFELGMVEHFGKAVFLTKEEAEQKLAEMKGKNSNKG